jgi:RND superfamily putative drug exporter
MGDFSMLRGLGEFITKKPLAIIALWAIILIVSVPLALNLDSRLHYDITSFIPKNLESYNSNQIYEKQFPNDSQSQMVVAVQSDNKTLAMHFIDDLNRTVGNDTRIKNMSSTTSVYDIQRLALVNMAPELHSTLLDGYDNASDANRDLYNATDTVLNSSRDLYYLKDNVTKVNSQLYYARKQVLTTSQQLYSARDQIVSAHDGLYQVKGAADMLFGLPLYYVSAYGQAMAGGMTDAQASGAALSATDSYITGSGSVTSANQALALGYISYFNGYWNAYAGDADPMDRAQKVLSNNVDNFIRANVPAGQEQTLLLNARSSLSLSSYTNAANVKAFCIGAVMQSENLDSSYQSKLSAIYDLGASPSGVAYDNMVLSSIPADQQSAAREIYDLGRNPSDGTVGSYVVGKALQSVNKTDTNATQIIQDAWNLGPSETNADFDKYVVDKATKDMNATEKAQVQQIYDWGPDPNDTTIRDYVLQQAGSGHNASENQTIAEIYDLGQNASSDAIRNYVVTKAASELNVTGNLSFFGAIMEFDRNTSDAQLESFARDWAYSHDYSNPQIFTDSIVSNLASGNLTLYAVMLDDDEASQDAHNAVGYVRDDIASVKNNGTYAGVTTYVTGVSPFAVDTMTAATGDVDNIDKISVILILIILGVYFLSILTPFIPLAVIGAAIVSGFGLLYLASYTVDLYYLTKTFMIVVMLGAGTDYCVFLLTR